MTDTLSQEKLLQMIQEIKTSPDFQKAGMLLIHNGVVRETSRDGKKVKGLMVQVNHGVLKGIIQKAESLPGIVDVRIHIEENRFLSPGEDIMFLAVSGDVRENVSTVLMETLDAVKTKATTKQEYYTD